MMVQYHFMLEQETTFFSISKKSNCYMAGGVMDDKLYKDENEN